MNFIQTQQGQKILNTFLKKYKSSSKNVYSSEIKQFFEFYTGDICKLTDKDIIEYRNHLLLSVSSKSLTRKISILSKFFKYVEGKVKDFKNPISDKYGSQARYKKAYPKTEKYEIDVSNWLDSLQTRSNTKITYRINLNQFFEWFQRAPKEITPVTMEKYKEYLEKKYTASTVWLRYVALNSFLKYIIGTNKTSKVLSFKKLMLVPPKKDKGYYQVLQNNEIERLFYQPDTSTLIGKRDLAILRLLCTYGLRANEVCKIKYGDFEGKRVKKQQKLWIKDRKGKAGNRTDTAIILNGKVLKAVDDWLSSVGIKIKADKDTPLFNQFKWNMPRGVLELDKNRIDEKQVLSVRTIENIIEKYVKKAALEATFKISPHALRHSALTLLAKEGVQLIDLKYLAGHQNISTTMIYIHSVQSYNDHVGMYHPLNKDI